MPEAPKIFLSAATSDLQSARLSASAALRALGWQPILADQSEPASSAFWQQTQPAMRECGAVVHIVGLAYGNEPGQRLAAEPRRSYAQLEYDLAIALRRPLIVFICDERFPFDAHPAEDADKRRLQQIHRTFLQSQGRPFQFVSSVAELDHALREQCPAPMPARLPIRPPVASGSLPTNAPESLPPDRHRALILGVFAALVILCALLAVGVAILLRDRISLRAPIQLAPAAPKAVPPMPVPPVEMLPPRPMPTPDKSSRPVTVVTAPAPAVVVAPTPRPPVVSPIPPIRSTDAPPAVVIDSSLVNSATRTEVRKRIEIAPDIAPEKKERLSEMVARAKEMRRLIILPFGTGESQIPTEERMQALKRLDSPDLASYRDDLTCVFVVLGFADVRGSNPSNLRLSSDRARRVRDLMQQEAAVKNIIHPVGMGETTLLDDQQLEKNRIAEIWVIRP